MAISKSTVENRADDQHFHRRQKFLKRVGNSTIYLAARRILRQPRLTNLD